MATADNLTDHLTSVADAIREKSGGGTNKINPQDFAERIKNLSGGGEPKILYGTVTLENNTMWVFPSEFTNGLLTIEIHLAIGTRAYVMIDSYGGERVELETEIEDDIYVYVMVFRYEIYDETPAEVSIVRKSTGGNGGAYSYMRSVKGITWISESSEAVDADYRIVVL